MTALVTLVAVGATALHAADEAAPAGPAGDQASKDPPTGASFFEEPAPTQPTREPVSICVLDTGVRATHEAIAPFYAGGKDLVGDAPLPTDENGHGTQVVARVIQGFQRAAPDATNASLRVFVGKIAGADGKFLWTDFVEGLAWCQEQGAKIINLSLGDPQADDAAARALAAAAERGISIVAAAGNTGPCDDCVHFPARDPHVVAVGCVDANDALCAFSSTGPEVEVVALGRSVLAASSVSDTSYGARSGTSMASPFVAGVMAALQSLHADWSRDDLEGVLGTEVTDLGEPGRDALYGLGALDGTLASV